MEARATKLGMPQTLFYMNPNNARWLTPSDAAKVEKIGIKDHAVMDEHVGGGGGVEIARNMFVKYVTVVTCSARALAAGRMAPLGHCYQ
jgi:hypothetical protein